MFQIANCCTSVSDGFAKITQTRNMYNIQDMHGMNVVPICNRMILLVIKLHSTMQHPTKTL